MTDISAKQGLQNGGKSLQQIGLALALLAGIGLYIVYPMAILYIGLVTLGVLVAWHFAEKKAAYREAQARADSFANICGPVLISSIHPLETVDEVQARAIDFKKQLELSGNPHWQKIPILLYPYKPMLYGPGQLTAAWNIYQRTASEHLHNENLRWMDNCPAELRSLFLSQVMPTPQTETL